MKNRWLLVTALVAMLSTTFAQDWCENYGVKITETEIENDVVNVIYISSEIIFVQTDGYQTYRSGDEGKSWNIVTTDAQDAFRYVIPSANTSWIYFSTFSWTNQFYTSTDGGETLVARTSFPKDYFVEDLKPHPTLAEWALARLTPKTCKSGNCHEELYYTKDFGITWNFIESYVSSTYEWGETIINYEDPSNNHILIFYQTTNNKNGTQDPGLQLLKRYDVLFNSVNEVIFTGVNNFFKLPYNNSLLFVTREDPQVNVQLLISEDAGDSWVPAIFPFQLPFDGIEILDGSEGAVLVNILHDITSTSGYIYISDAYTSEFSLILKNNIHTGSYFYGASDFIKVQNLHGIYVANVYEEIEEKVSNKIKTMLTFDFGGEWTRINPPVNDSQGNPVQCVPGEQCFLNLYGLLENMYGRFYSSPDAIGILLATGNVGEYLSQKTGDLNTYMSRDAGWSWTEVSKGSLAYEMGDQGAILLFAENSQPTNTMLYTWTEGLTFTECMFTNGSNVDVTNIVVEPSYTSEKFLLYGSRGNKGVLIHVDFTGIQPRPCQNPEMAGTNSSDYELWSPSDLVTDDSTTQCLLGAHRVYTRRKRDSECFNPSGYTPKVTVTGCACTIEDYDCDFCWETNEDYACTYVCVPPYDEVPIPCDDYYYVSQGYRRIPGDNCNASAGLNLLPQRYECPAKPATQSSSHVGPNHTGVIVAAILVTVAVLVLVVGGIVSWKLKKPAGLWKKKETKYTMVATDEFEDVE